MPRAAEARAWWADVEDVRERIERRRARESRVQAPGGTTAVPAVRRGVREVSPGRQLMLVRTGVPAERYSRRRPRRRAVHRVGPRPDRIAAWAVGLGFLLVLVAVLSAHG
jgi:hypothetical protein